jgi:hypothetical protein
MKWRSGSDACVFRTGGSDGDEVETDIFQQLLIDDDVGAFETEALAKVGLAQPQLERAYESILRTKNRTHPPFLSGDVNLPSLVCLVSRACLGK